MSDSFIPHGSRCEADDGRGPDFGKCREAATRYVTHEGIDRPVCAFHFYHYQPRFGRDRSFAADSHPVVLGDQKEPKWAK